MKEGRNNMKQIKNLEYDEFQKYLHDKNTGHIHISLYAWKSFFGYGRFKTGYDPAVSFHAFFGLYRQTKRGQLSGEDPLRRKGQGEFESLKTA